MSNKLCLHERGYFTEPEISSRLKISISYNSCRYPFVIASARFNIDHVTTQYTPKCVENCSDNKISIIIYLTSNRFSVSSAVALKTAFFLNRRLIIFVMNRCFSCAQTVTLR